jgi:hypothetical protein
MSIRFFGLDLGGRANWQAIVVLGSWLGIFVGVNEDLSGRKLEPSSLNPDGKSRKENGGMGEWGKRRLDMNHPSGVTTGRWHYLGKK